MKRLSQISTAILICLVGTISSANAQDSYQIKLGGDTTDAALYLEQTNDGGFIITGHTSSFGAGNWDIYLVKLDKFANIEWSRVFGGAGYEVGNAVKQTFDGGYIIAGYTNSFGAGGFDMYLIKTNSLGNLQWSKTIGGSRTDFGISVMQAYDSSFIVTGYTNSYGTDSTDVYLVKMDSKGKLIWSRTYGGNKNERGFETVQSVDSGYITVGYTSSYGSGLDDIYVIRSDKNGMPLWGNAYGENGFEQGHAILLTKSGKIVVSGFTTSSGNATPYVIALSLNLNGNIFWGRAIGGDNFDFGQSIFETPKEDLVICGYTNSFSIGNTDAYLVKLRSYGGMVWTKTYGNKFDDFGYCAKQLSDGSIGFIGEASNNLIGNSDVYFVKTDSLGGTGCNKDVTSKLFNTSFVKTPGVVVDSGAIVKNANTVQGFPTTFDSLLCSSSLSSNITLDNSYGNLLITPNPAADNIEISMQNLNQRVLALEVFNIKGEAIFTQVYDQTKGNNIDPYQIRINLSKYPAGLYFVNAITDQGIISSKFIHIK